MVGMVDRDRWVSRNEEEEEDIVCHERGVEGHEIR
jgi:hypothetical protein